MRIRTIIQQSFNEQIFNDTAIRIRVVVGSQHHTMPCKGQPAAPTLQRQERCNVGLNTYFTVEGQTRPEVSVHARRITARARVHDTAIRMRVVVGSPHHTMSRCAEILTVT